MILRGLLLLARGRKTGMAEFDNSTDGLLASLAPLIAFPLVGAGRTALQGQPVMAVAYFLARLCAVLALPLLVYEFARIFKREAEWRRAATVLDWSFWMLLPMLLAAAFVGALLVEAGMTDEQAEMVALSIMLVWLLWYQWFIIRAALQLGRLPALMVLALNTAAVGLLTDGPWLLSRVITG